MTADIRVEDVGTAFRVTVVDENGVAVDLSSATLLRIKFQKPDRTDVTKTALLVNDGTDGLMQYVTVAGDLDQQGYWEFQGYVELPAGKWHTSISSFKVKPNLS